MDDFHYKNLPWWKSSLWSSVAIAAIACLLLPAPLTNWKLVLSIAVVVFIALAWLNPNYRYRRFAGRMTILWATSRIGSFLVICTRGEQNSLAFAFYNGSSGLFDLSVALCICLALFLDYKANVEPRVWKSLKLLFPLQISRTSTETNLGTQTNISGVVGDVHIHQPVSAVSQREIEDALSPNANQATPSVPAGAYHDQIDAATKFMKDDNIDVAIALLKKLKQRSWDQMDDRQKFRTLANLGHCHTRKDNHTEALTCFSKALSHQPSDIDGRCYFAAALLANGRGLDAKQHAEQIISENPDTAVAHAILLRTSPPEVNAKDLWDALPSTVQNAASVLSALGWRAANQQDYVFALKMAEIGSGLEEVIHDFDVLRAAVAIGETSIRVLVNPPATEPEAIKLNEAIDALKVTEKHYERFPAGDQLGQVYYYQASAYRLLGKATEVDYACRQAIKFWPSNLPVARQYVIFLNDNGRADEAIAVFDNNSKHKDDVESQVLWAACLAERDGNSDLSKALSMLQSCLEKLDQVDLATVSNALNVLGALHRRSGSLDAALQDIEKVTHAGFSNAHRIAHIANAYLNAGQVDKAKENALKAVGQLAEEDEIGLWDVGSSCMNCGLFDEALSAYLRFVTPQSPKKLIMAVLECGERSENALAVLRFCTDLRENEVFLEAAIELEAVTREEYDDLDGALQALNSYLERYTEGEFPKIVKLRKAVLGIKYDRAELLRVEQEELPAVDKVNGRIGTLVIAVLREQGKDQDALEYAYELLRRNFDDAAAHRGFVDAVGHPGSESELPTPDVVQPGTAVYYQAAIGEEHGWWILEDSENPIRERHELDIEHPIALSLNGKKVGDEFNLRESGLQEVKAKILKIVSKYQYRFGEIFDKWEERFPDEFFVWKITTQNDEHGQPDISPILKSLDDKEKQTERIHDIYKQSPMSIISFSTLTNTDAIQATAHLAGSLDLEIRCCFGNEDEYVNAVACTGTASVMVACPSAIATLWLIRAYEDIRDLPFRLLVPRGVKEQVRRKKLEFPFRGDAFLGKIDGQYVLTHNTAEEREREEVAYVDFYNWLEAVTETIDGLALAELPRKLRNNLKDIFGVEAAQSLALAKSLNVPLWTDDLGVAELGRSQLGIDRTWTEVVLCSLRVNERLGDEKLASFIAALNGSGYRHSRLTPEVVVASAKIAEWNPEHWPFPSVVSWCKNPDVSMVGITQIVTFSLPMLWRSAALVEQAEAISEPLLETVKDFAGTDTVLRAIINNIEQIFGVDVIGAEQCRKVAEKVLSKRPNRHLFLPSDSDS